MAKLCTHVRNDAYVDVHMHMWTCTRFITVNELADAACIDIGTSYVQLVSISRLL